MKQRFSQRDEDRYAAVVDAVHDMDAYELMEFREDIFNAMARHWLTPHSPRGGRTVNIRWDSGSIDHQWLHRGVAWVTQLPYGEVNNYHSLRVTAGNRGYELAAFMNNQLLYRRKFTNKEGILYFLDAQDTLRHRIESGGLGG